MTLRLTTAALLALLASVPAPARAETVGCTAVTSLPATISTPGVYCLVGDVSTAGTGPAIKIEASGVTLDCNGYKVGGLAAGPAAANTGIIASAKDDLLIRNCTVRGFLFGIHLDGHGNAVIGNRVEGSRDTGIRMHGSEMLVRDNLVYDTGLHVTDSSTIGIQVGGTGVVVGNTVDTVIAQPGSGASAFGIASSAGVGSLVARNRIRSVIADEGGYARAVNIVGVSVSVRDNVVMGITGYGIDCYAGVVASGNHVSASIGLDGCTDGGGNMVID